MCACQVCKGLERIAAGYAKADAEIKALEEAEKLADQRLKESVEKTPAGPNASIFDLEGKPILIQNIRLKQVNVEKVYTNEERDEDASKIRRLFDMDKSAMEQLISEPNGKRYLEEFVLKPDSIHQCQR